MRASLLLGATLAMFAAATKADPLVEPADWRCEGSQCVIRADVRNDDRPGEVAIAMAISVDRSTGKVTRVLFRLPHYKRDGLFSFAFRRTRKDAAGQLKTEPVREATRKITITDCDPQECRLDMPEGVLAARDDSPSIDVGAQMLKQDLMQIIYVSGGDTYGAVADLPRLQAAYRALMGKN